MLAGKRILLVIAGGIAAYKSLDLIRRLRERGAMVRCILTRAGAQFVTPLSVAALSEEKVYSDLFSLTDESEMGHIRLSREADLVVVAPATADLLAKLAAGLADDLASTALLATDKPVLVAPTMNVMMWGHAATQANVATLAARGVRRVGPDPGALACGEVGSGRMAEPLEIVAAVEAFFAEAADKPLAGRRAVVTSGPTREPLDPVRYIANRSSGKQGHAIAAALARLGAETVLVSGPSAEPDPQGVAVVHVETAREMLAACEKALPADIAVCAAAVVDWRPAEAATAKLKKNGPAKPLVLVENPDILATLSAAGNRRPRLVVGFAAETDDVVAYATAKRAKKGCDWMLANDVSPASGTFGGDHNTIHLVSAAGVEDWPRMTKAEVAERLARRVSEELAGSAA
ncbi:MAG: bifunctional phosphopantothenoylcysteine decarboxylase/phosphopantothenate--cysteine ligase CoaBC [Alphaproteobacteria bacterium]|nr:bifunctional phosphopantothenoylcysteine decarboxylase/phosphopantothenate--cysteine ligase CoaBC [Alphaproteobacteria bacterium]